MIKMKSPVKGKFMMKEGKEYYIIEDNFDRNKAIPSEVSEYINKLIKSNKIDWELKKVATDQLAEMERLHLLPNTAEIKSIKIYYAVIDCSEKSRGLSTLYTVTWLKLI